jgi:single-stranded DNA-binding protein
MDISGKVKVVMETMKFDSGFQKREFVVTTQEQYPQDIKFEVVQDKVSLLDGIQSGDSVKVGFDIRGNEYQGRYFVNLRAWKLDKEGAAPAPADGQAPPPSMTDLPPDTGGDDDLPF